MSARDDFGSNAGTSRGYAGGAGGLGNGGVGGGMGGGFQGGGAARNGGIGSRTGLTTGNKMVGIPGRNGLTFSGRPGGFAKEPGAYGIQSLPAVAQGPLNRPTIPRMAAIPASFPVAPSYPAYNAEMALPTYPRVPGLLGGTNVNEPAVTDDMLPGPSPASYTPPAAYNPSMVVGGSYPTPSVGTYPTQPAPYKATWISPSGGWPGQNSYYGSGSWGKAFDDRVPQVKR